MSTNRSELNSKLADLNQRSSAWSEPVKYSLGDHTGELLELVNDNRISRVVDPINDIAGDLYELHNPDKLDDIESRSSFVEEILREGDNFGEWFYFPWNDSLIRYPNKNDHYELRTFRNKHLITNLEQQKLRQSTIAFAGLSVGSNIVDQVHRSGIGDTYIIMDKDILSPTNLNRVYATMGQVGLSKVDVVARKISELDPYTRQVHCRDGYSREAEDIINTYSPGILVEEVDDLSVKAQMRQFAHNTKTPLVSVGDMDDRSILDIERHDLHKVSPFNGKLSERDFNGLIAGDIRDIDKVMMKIIGIRNLSPRLIESAMAKGVDIAGFPQLGSTASAGAAMATFAIREILLGRGSGSGSYSSHPRETIGGKRPTTYIQDIGTLARFARRKKQT